MKQLIPLLVCVALLSFAGCATTPRKIKKLELGMTPEQVKKSAGEPSAIRAAKVYEDGHTEEVWEYLSSFAVNPKDYWLFFKDGKLVQWGEPGDFSGLSSRNGEIPVKEYAPVKRSD